MDVHMAWTVLRGLVREAGCEGRVNVRALARGRYGSVWAVRGPTGWPRVRAALAARGERALFMPDTFGAAQADENGAVVETVAVKVQVWDAEDPGAAARAQLDAELEERAQQRAHRAAPPCGVRAGWRVPRVLGGATVPVDGTRASRARVTFMELVRCDGCTLHEMRHRRSPTLCRALFERLQKAVRAVWVAGVVHGDLHDCNIAVEHGTDAVVLLDWGLAVHLGRRARRALCTAADDAGDDADADVRTDAAWDAVARPAFERAMARRGIPLDKTHPDGARLRRARATWGAPAAPNIALAHASASRPRLIGRANSF